CAIWFVIFIVGVLYALGESVRQQKERYDAAVARRAEQGQVEEPPAEDAADRPGPKGRPRGPRGRGDDQQPFNPDNWFFTAVRGVHYVLPRAKDLDYLMSQILYRDLLTANQIKARSIDRTRVSWEESLTVSGIFIALMLGLSCLRFATK